MRRGNIGDGSTILMVLGGMAILMLIVLYMLVNVSAAFQADNSLPTLSKTVMSRFATTSQWVFDFWFVLFFIGLPLISMALAYFNDIPAVFFWLGMMVDLVLLVIAKAVSSIWVAFTGGSLASTASLMPITNFIMSNFTVYALLMILLIAGGTYVKTRGPGGYYG